MPWVDLFFVADSHHFTILGCPRYPFFHPDSFTVASTGSDGNEDEVSYDHARSADTFVYFDNWKEECEKGPAGFSCLPQ